MLLVTEFTNERGETYTVLQLLKRLRMAIIQIDGILFDHQKRIEILEIDVEKIKNDIDDIKEQLLNVINRVDIVENKVEIVEETLITIENNITSIETILNNHDGDILALNTLVTNITTELNELQGIVDSIPIVSASPLNGYIKIDGIDTPVFVGGGSGGDGGSSGIIAKNSNVTTMATGTTELITIELPDFKGDIMRVDVPITFHKLNVLTEFNLKIYGYNEKNEKKVMTTLTSPTLYEQGYQTLHIFFHIKKERYAWENGGFINCVSSIPDGDFFGTNTRFPEIAKKIVLELTVSNTVDVYPFNVVATQELTDGDGDSGGSDENNIAVYSTKLNTLTNDDLNKYKKIWSLPCPPSAIGENSRFEYDATYAISVDKIDKINFQCSIMGAEMNLGEININSFEENFVYMKINLIGGTRKINDTEYYTSSNIEVIISNSNTSTKTSRVLARLNSNRGGNGVIGVDDNISFNMMFTGDEVANRNSSMARGMLKSFYDIKELI